MHGMFHGAQHFIEHLVPPAFVVQNCSSDDVAKAIIENGQQNEPFHIFDMDEAYRHIQRFKHSMPRVQMFYAMKANDSEMMLKLAVAMELGFDCASPGEICRIRNLNVPPTSIIYAVPTKTPEQMLYARLSQVKHTTFDTSYELKKLKQYWPDAKLLIRIRVDSDSVYKLGDKFGCDFETEAVDLLEEAATLGLTVTGVAFHVGSVCFSSDSYVVGLRQARALFDHEAKAGRQMKILDIGGGYYCENTEKFDEVSQLINETLAKLFPDPAVQVIAEPGRYCCDTAFKLYCNINNVKTVKQNNKLVNMIYLNDGSHGTLKFIEPWQKVHKFNSSSGIEEILEDTILWGPTSDPKDHVARQQLPRCSPHDWLVFTMQGAYTLVFAGRFAGNEIPLIRPVISKSVWTQIRNNPVFSQTDFIVNPDMAAPLPSTLPPLLPCTSRYDH